MMLPSTDIYPKNIVIDPTDSFTITWTSQGSPCTAFKIIMYKVKDNSVIHDSGKVISKECKYIVPSNTLPVNEDIYYILTSFDGDEFADANAVFLRTANNPTVSFIDLEPISPTQKVEVTLDYKQEQSIPIKTYRIILYNEFMEQLFDSNEKYGLMASPLLLPDLRRGHTYFVKGIVTSQTNQIAETSLNKFSIANYEPIEPTTKIKAESNPNTGNVTISWAELRNITGTVSGDFDYVTGMFGKGLLLSNTNSKLRYLDKIPREDFTISWYHKMTCDCNSKFIVLEDRESNIEMGYMDNRFYVISTDGTKYESDEILPFTVNHFSGQTLDDFKNRKWGDFDDKFIDEWLFIQLTEDRLLIKTTIDIEQTLVDMEIRLNPTANHRYVDVYGKSVLDAFHVYRKKFTHTEMKTNDIYIQNIFDEDTLILGEFEGNLRAGNIDSLDDTMDGWILKRREKYSDTNIILAKLDKYSLSFEDVTTVNNTIYEYELSATNKNGEGLSQVKTVEVKYWGWVLSDMNTSYVLKYGLDGVTSSNISQAISYSMVETFNSYPTMNFSNKKAYKTGTLTAIPYQLDESDLLLSVHVLNDFEQFINNAKPKILKNTLGEVFKVETSDFSYKIQETIDDELFTVSFKFTQIGGVEEWI